MDYIRNAAQGLIGTDGTGSGSRTWHYPEVIIPQGIGCFRVEAVRSWRITGTGGEKGNRATRKRKLERNNLAFMVNGSACQCEL